MEQRLVEQKALIRDGGLAKYRQNRIIDVSEEAHREGLTTMQACARLMQRACEEEIPTILPGERIAFTRTIRSVVPVRSGAEASTEDPGFCRLATWEPLNLCADWGLSLAEGLTGRRRTAECNLDQCRDDPRSVAFLDAAITAISAALDLAARYAREAEKQGCDDLAARFSRISTGPPESFHDALQSLRFMQAMAWLSGTSHVGLGRFDQYMWPYLRQDLESGVLTEQQALGLVEEFFISLNRDSDLYPGVQRGDNGQSMMLGGVTREGAPAVNPLTWLALQASREVGMIDPKINLRITKDTDLALLTEASRLTRMGLGFPQYSNDDVVIPGLIAAGYAPEDARDYTVAACWEFIIPGRGMDVPNIHALSFPAAADQAIREGLAGGEEFDHILGRVKENIRLQVRLYADEWKGKSIFPPNPFYSALMTDCLRRGRDINQGGATYHNYGIHGAGSSNAVDALAAVRKLVLEEGLVSGHRIVEALDSNYASDEPLRQMLLSDAPHTGDNEPVTNDILRFLYDCFADACEREGNNGRGGVFRPGTGTAMYYLWLVDRNASIMEPLVGASADGRLEGQPLSCGLSPSPGARVQGPVSVLQTFANIDYKRVCNGGPITIELSDTVFRNEDALGKVAMLVRSFASLGCQQLQLNTLNVEKLMDAKLHPENYQNLIVRVWGWSGYFCELDERYQDHIIGRHMFTA